MSYQQAILNLDATTINKLTTAIEIGRWENGDKLSDKQREDAMQAVMLWQANLSKEQPKEPFKVNGKGEFKIGKGAVLNDVPIEYRSEQDENVIFIQK